MGKYKNINPLATKTRCLFIKGEACNSKDSLMTCTLSVLPSISSPLALLGAVCLTPCSSFGWTHATLLLLEKYSSRSVTLGCRWPMVSLSGVIKHLCGRSGWVRLPELRHTVALWFHTKQEQKIENILNPHTVPCFGKTSNTESLYQPEEINQVPLIRNFKWMMKLEEIGTSGLNIKYRLLL